MHNIFLMILMYLASFLSFLVGGNGRRKITDCFIMAACSTLMAWGALELICRLYIGRPL